MITVKLKGHQRRTRKQLAGLQALSIGLVYRPCRVVWYVLCASGLAGFCLAGLPGSLGNYLPGR